MEMATPVGAAWAAHYRPGMSQKEARAFIAGFEAATPELEYAWRDEGDHYWPLSTRDHEEGETLDAAHDAADADWFEATDGVALYARTKAITPGEWRRA